VYLFKSSIHSELYRHLLLLGGFLAMLWAKRCSNSVIKEWALKWITHRNQTSKLSIVKARLKYALQCLVGLVQVTSFKITSHTGLRWNELADTFTKTATQGTIFLSMDLSHPASFVCNVVIFSRRHQSFPSPGFLPPEDHHLFDDELQPSFVLPIPFEWNGNSRYIYSVSVPVPRP